MSIHTPAATEKPSVAKVLLMLVFVLAVIFVAVVPFIAANAFMIDHPILALFARIIPVVELLFTIFLAAERLPSWRKVITVALACFAAASALIVGYAATTVVTEQEQSYVKFPKGSTSIQVVHTLNTYESPTATWHETYRYHPSGIEIGEIDEATGMAPVIQDKRGEPQFLAEQTFKRASSIVGASLEGDPAGFNRIAGAGEATTWVVFGAIVFATAGAGLVLGCITGAGTRSNTGASAARI